MTPTARFDVILATVLSVISFLLIITIDPMEQAVVWNRMIDSRLPDAILTMLFFTTISIIWFAIRRSLEAKKLYQRYEQTKTALDNAQKALAKREAEPQASETQFRTLVEHAPVGIYIFQDGRYHYANPRFAEMFGYTVEEIMTTHPNGAALIAAEDVERVQAHIRQLVGGEVDSLRYAFRGKRKEGGFVDIEMLSAIHEFEGRRAITSLLLDISERQQAEAALRFDRQLLQTVMDAMPMRISVRSIDGERLVINRATRELWGHTAEQPLPPGDAVPHLHASEIQFTEAARLKVLQRGQPLHYERARTLADDSQEWIQAYWTPLRNEQADMIGTVCITENITKRKQAEDALQKSEAHQRLLVARQAMLSEIGRIISASPDINDVYAPFTAAVQRLLPFDRMAISLVDSQTGLITNSYVNGIDVSARRAKADIPLSGTLTEATLDAPHGILFHPRHSVDVSQRFPGLLPLYQAGLQSFLSVPLKSRNTVLGTLQLQARLPKWYTERHRSLALSVGRQIAGAVATARLYRELQAAEQALRESEEQFRGLIENSPAAICFKDCEGRLRLVNQRFLQWYSHSENALLGATSCERASEPYAERIDLHDRHVLATQTMVEQEIDGTFADGTRHSILVTKYPVINASGEAIGVGAIHSDVTDRKRAEARIERRNEELRQAVQERTREMEALMARIMRQEKLATIGQIAGSIAHELRNPLSVLKQSLFYLTRLHHRGRLESTNPQVPDYIQLMDAEINAAERVISQLLAFARSTPPSPQWLDLRELLRDVLRQKPLGDDVRVRMIFVPYSYQLYADRWCMQHVFLNLLSNAADACEGVGTVTIHAQIDATAHQYHIALRDTGRGIPNDDLQHVFEPLYSRKMWGTGLGLSLCQQLIEQQGGAISLESQEGRGTTVELRLPMPPETSL